MSPIVKKASRILMYLFMALVLLFLLLVGAVNLPVVHKALTKKTNAVLLEKGIPAQIGKITLLLNGNIGINELAIITPPNDTIIYAGKVSVDLSMLQLISKKLVISNITLTDAVVNILSDSITGDLNIVSVFKRHDSSPPKAEDETVEPDNQNAWDIQGRNIQFKNIRFVYSDPPGGILVKQNLARAEIDFDAFSLLEKQIDVENIEIEKPVGMVTIWKGTRVNEEEPVSNIPWNFSVQNLVIDDLLFTLEQPDDGQNIDIKLKNGHISLDKLNLATSEIFIDEIELNKPDVTFINVNKVDKEVVNQTSTLTFSIPVLPWTIQAGKFKIKDGSLNYSTSNIQESASLEKWLPVNGLNASFENTQITPEGYNINLEKISFAMANTLKIKSGSLQFKTDSLQNIGLKAGLSALVARNKISGITKETQLDFTAALNGSSSEVQIKNIGLQSSSGLSFNITGKILDLLQMPQSKCDLKFFSGNITQSQLTTVVKLIDSNIKLPGFESFTVSGSIKNSFDFPVFTLNVKSGSGNIKAEGRYDIKNNEGKLDASLTDILVSKLFGETYPEKISGNISLNGGLNSSNQPEGEVFLKIDSVQYKNKTTRNILLRTEVYNNQAELTLQAADSALKLDLTGNIGWNEEKNYTGNIKGGFDVDVFAMNLATEQLAVKGNIESNLEYSPISFISKSELNGFTVSANNQTAVVDKSVFYINTTDSIIESDIETGFLTAHFKSHAPLNDFKTAFNSTRLETVINLDSSRFFNLNAISNLADFNFEATVRHNSIFNLFYPDSVLNFSDIKILIDKSDKDSTTKGSIATDLIHFNNFKFYKSFIRAGIEHDRMTFRIKTDSIVGEQASLGKTGLDIDILPSNITGKFYISNEVDSILHQIGFQAERKNERVIFKSATPFWVINKNPYNLSPLEFLTWDKTSKLLTANLRMHSGEKQINFTGKSTEKLELDVKNIEFNNFAIPGLIGFVPDGILNANVKYSNKEKTNLELNLEMLQMKWGNLQFKSLAATGHLIADSTGILESKILINADDSLSLSAQMKSNNANDEFNVKSKFNKLHFQLFQPFIIEYADNLHGSSSGEITIGGKKGKITLNGEIRFQDFGLEIIPLKTRLSIPDNKIAINENQFLFNNFTVIDSLKRPLTVNGKIVYVNNDDINVDLKVKADKIQLMNTEQSDKTPLFGSLIVNSGLSIGGSIYSPTIKGNIELESGTNLTYQLIQDLSVAGSQNDVVFAAINDSLRVIYPVSEKVSQPTKMPMIETTIGINRKSIFNVKIADIYNVDITIAGDGLLNYTMLPNNTMSLNGNYQIETGDCKLKITGWPMKNFNITPGSSFAWNGNIENPTLNLEATTKVKGSYANPIDNKSRVVDFVVSMQLKNQLSDLSILFDIQSNDQYITSVISSLSADEKIRQAVNLLLFETIDIPGIESSSNYLASQMSSFWESQLNSLSSSKLNKTKLSFGIDTYNQSTTEGGNQEKTSFTYEMERKFMNDRATVRLSGKLNDYNEGAYQTNSLFENFIFEYALDSLNTKNIKLYQKRDYEDMLEGEVIKYGVGFLYRKSYKTLKDIWQRGKREKLEKNPMKN